MFHVVVIPYDAEFFYALHSFPIFFVQLMCMSPLAGSQKPAGLDLQFSKRGYLGLANQLSHSSDLSVQAYQCCLLINFASSLDPDQA